MNTKIQVGKKTKSVTSQVAKLFDFRVGASSTNKLRIFEPETTDADRLLSPNEMVGGESQRKALKTKRSETSLWGNMKKILTNFYKKKSQPRLNVLR